MEYLEWIIITCSIITSLTGLCLLLYLLLRKNTNSTEEINITIDEVVIKYDNKPCIKDEQVEEEIKHE